MRELRWHIATLQRPLDPVRVADLLRRWAADQRSPQITLETRLRVDGTQYLIGTASANWSALRTSLGVLPNLSVRPLKPERQPITTAGHLKANTRHRPLRLNDPAALVRAVLATGMRLRADEQLVVQVVLGPRRIPLAVPNASPSSVVQPWWSVAWLGNGGQVDGEKRQALRTKVSDFGFATTIRLGVSAETAERRKALLLGLVAAVRVSEAPGVQLRFRREPARHLNTAARPWRWPLRLGVPELVGLVAWPLGDSDLPGQPALHPKLLPPSPGTTGTERVVGDSLAPDGGSLALPAKNATHHALVLGPTGSGKSHFLASLILQDIAAGRGVVVIEPKGDLVTAVLERLPNNRRDDVALVSPTEDITVGLNPLARRNGQRADLLADNLLAIFKQVFGKNIGPRSSDILYAALATLARRDDATLALLPLILTNDGIRRSLTAGLRDPLVLEPFWATFESWSPAERAAAVAPALNKIRSFLRPGLVSVLGQRRPRFDISQVFTERKLLFLPLQRGVIGADAASLIGTVAVSMLWQAIEARAAVPPAERHTVMVYIDEAGSYVNTGGTDLGDMLAMARGYGVAITIASQTLDQYPRDMRSQVLANTRSKITFAASHDDARVLERGHPELQAIDIESLGQYEIYASLYAHGRSQPYASARTRPLPPPTADVAALKRRSRELYGQPLDDIERGFTELLDKAVDQFGLTGRKPRRTS